MASTMDFSVYLAPLQVNKKAPISRAALTISAEVLVGAIVDVSINLARAAVPVSMEMLTVEPVTFAITLKAATVTWAQGDTYVLTRPKRTISMEMLAGTAVDAALTLARVSVTSTVMAGVKLDFAIELAPATVVLEPLLTSVLDVSITLPVLSVEVTDLTEEETTTQRPRITIEETRRGLILSPKFQAFTRYLAIVDSMCVFNGVLLGTGTSGIFRLDRNDLSGTSPIRWKIGVSSDFGSPLVKQVRVLRLNGVLTKTIRVIVSVDEQADEYFVMPPTGSGATNRPTECVIGKGLRGVLWSFVLEDIYGADLKIVELSAVVQTVGSRTWIG